MPYSPFAMTLRRLLDDTNFYTRQEWSQFLDISMVSFLDQWVTDQAIPTPSRLRMILDILRVRADAKNVLQEFDALSKRPAVDVAPKQFCDRLSPTIEVYLQQTYADFGKSLSRVPQSVMMTALTQGSWV